jgi:ubiquinone biosynthesis monooxygenase Coq6
MINAAFRLPEVSVRYLHGHLLDVPSLSPDDLRAEISFREQAHAIAPYSALASANVHPAEAGVGIPDEGAHGLPPLVADIQPGTVASFPLRFRHAEAYIGNRTALIGDAAHVIHPLAGQGLNLGLGDAAALARCIQTAVMHGGDIGSRTALVPYTRERYFENHKMMSAVDKLHKLYASTAPPLVWARSTGVEVLNELDTLKAGIIGAAGGRSSAHSVPGSPWEMVAGGVETLVSGTRVMGAVGTGLRSVAGGILQQLGRVASGPGKDQRE